MNGRACQRMQRGPGNRLLAGPVLMGIAFCCSCAAPEIQVGQEVSVDFPSNWSASTDSFEGSFEQGWLSDFDDPILPLLVAEALTHNHDLAASAARLQAVWSNVRQTGADRLPQVSGNYSGSRRQRTSTGGFVISSNRSNSFNVSLDLSWELDLWGRLRNRRGAAYADWEAADADQRGARLSLAAQTAKAWFTTIQSELEVRLLEKTLASFENNLTVIQEQFERGLTPALDLRLTRANVAATRSTTEAQRRRHQSNVRALEVILGRYPANRLATIERLPTIMRAVPAGIPSELINRRPDLVAAERRLTAADHRLRESRKLLLPSIRLTAGGGTSSAEFADLLDSTFKVWNLASGVSQPLFQGRRIRAGIERSDSNRVAAMESFSQTALNAFREVETALGAEHYLAREESALRIAAEESTAAENLAWNRYQSGLTDIITVLESQRRAFTAQRSFIQISNERLQNRVGLYLALGGDYLPTEPANPN